MSSVGEIYNTCVKLVENAIGDKLYKVKGPNNTRKPSIYKVRATAQEGRLVSQLPFVVITSNGRRRGSFGVTDRWYNADGDEVLRSIYSAVVTIGVYGGDAEQLASDLEMYLFTDQALQIMCEGNIIINDTFGVNPDTTVLDGQAQDFASIQIQFSTNGTVVQSVYDLNTISTTLRQQYNDSDVEIISNLITYP